MRLFEDQSILRRACFWFIMTALCSGSYGTTIYVDDNATDDGTGSSWQHAIDSLQDALLLASSSAKPVEIRVAQGTYRPDHGSGVETGDREASFALMNGVVIRGGYAGAGSPDPDARDVKSYETILSGNLSEEGRIDDNSYHVISSRDTDVTAVLNGCTITAGYATGIRNGGGMANVNGSPTIIDCTFRDNAGMHGGALYIVGDSRPVLNNCIFSENWVTLFGGAIFNSSNPTLTNCSFNGNRGRAGGAIYNNIHSESSLTSCIFHSNRSAGEGGAIHNNQSNSVLTECAFEANSAGRFGGAVFNAGAKPLLVRCVFKNNAADLSGGALYNCNDSDVAIANCLFTSNSAGTGGAVANDTRSHTTLSNCTFVSNSANEGGGALSNTSDAQTTVTNSILWADTPDETHGDGVTVTYSDIQGGMPGKGNIDVAPLFAQPDGDYHLKSQSGRWSSDTRCWVADTATSPCIDAGSQTNDTGFEPAPNGNCINMGTYGGTREASLSWREPAKVAEKASDPNPPNGAIGVAPDTVLSWTVGKGAVGHDIHAGRGFDAVAESTRDNPVALVSQNQDFATYEPNDRFWWPAYYWRVDEVDAQDRITKGDVWMFTRPVSKGRACFTPDTLIWAEDTPIPISQAHLAQHVDGLKQLTETVRFSRCINTPEQVQEHESTFTCYDLYFETGNCVTVASNHYFMSESGGWVCLRDIVAGIRLRTATGSVAVAAVYRRLRPYTGKVYNLKIKDSDHYLVGKDALIARDY